jgi:hypothetical protein
MSAVGPPPPVVSSHRDDWFDPLLIFAPIKIKRQFLELPVGPLANGDTA